MRSKGNKEAIFSRLRDSFPSVPTWDLSPCSVDDVSSAIDNLKNTMSSGPDGIPNRLLKCVKSYILEPLTAIINKSILTGRFPAIWKESKVVPVPKGGCKLSVNNYRPIALTSTLGKVLEAVVYNQFHPHLETLLPENMFGFRRSKGTQEAVVNILDCVKSYKAAGKRVAILSVDAKAAFDTLSHDLVLGSMKILGFGPRMIEWSRSFFQDCRQFVFANGSVSDSWTVDVSAGQGRKMSPDYFNIGYLTQAIWSILSSYFGYADDGLDVIAGDSIHDCNEKIKLVAQLRADWFRDAGLPLNVAKSELLGFGFDPSPVTINNEIIHPSKCITFLGCRIQSDLHWDEQVTSLANKLRLAASRIRTDGRLFSPRDRLTLFNGWVLGSVHSNCLAFLPHLNDQQMNKLQISMNAGIRAVVNIPRYGQAPLSDIRSSLQIPSIHNILDKTILLEAWKRRSEFSPLSLLGPTTRARAKGNIPHPVQKGYNGQTTATKAMLAWNNLPLDVKSCSSFRRAKSLIKKFVMS